MEMSKMKKEELIQLLKVMIEELEAMGDQCKIDEYQRTLNQLEEEE
jgi:hypothetical protein